MDLLDCACGGSSWPPQYDPHTDTIYCPGCLARTPPCGSREAAAATWNGMQAAHEDDDIHQCGTSLHIQCAYWPDAPAPSSVVVTLEVRGEEHTYECRPVAAEPAEGAPIDLSTLRVGDAYRLRSGRLQICARIQGPLESGLYRIEATNHQGACEWPYGRDGAVYGGRVPGGHPIDIVEIIKGGRSNG